MFEAKVVSKFTNAINVNICGELYCIHMSNDFITPISIIVQEFVFNIIANMGVSNVFSIDLIKNEYNTLLHQYENKFFSIKPRQIRFTFSKNHLLTYLLRLDNDFAKYIIDVILYEHETNIKGLNKAISFFQVHQYENAFALLLKNIGFGEGLTPSFDDFLIGLISIFYLLNISKNGNDFKNVSDFLKNADFISKTTYVSNRYLTLAVANCFSSQIINIIAVLNGSLTEIFVEFEKLKRFGHSSGKDCLCGIIFGLYFLT